MEGLKDFKDMLARLECRNRRWRIGLVCAEDESSRMAAEWALQRKFVNVVFIGGTEIVLADKRFDRYRSHISVVRAESRSLKSLTSFSPNLVIISPAERPHFSAQLSFSTLNTYAPSGIL